MVDGCGDTASEHLRCLQHNCHADLAQWLGRAAGLRVEHEQIERDASDAAAQQGGRRVRMTIDKAGDDESLLEGERLDRSFHRCGRSGRQQCQDSPVRDPKIGSVENRWWLIELDDLRARNAKQFFCRHLRPPKYGTPECGRHPARCGCAHRCCGGARIVKGVGMACCLLGCGQHGANSNVGMVTFVLAQLNLRKAGRIIGSMALA